MQSICLLHYYSFYVYIRILLLIQLYIALYKYVLPLYSDTGECEPVDSMSVSGYCEAVSQSNRCPSLVGCSFAAQPVQGCCPICGKSINC